MYVVNFFHHFRRFRSLFSVSLLFYNSCSPFSMVASLPDMALVSVACAMCKHTRRQKETATILMPVNKRYNQLSRFLLQCSGVFFCCLAFGVAYNGF